MSLRNVGVVYRKELMDSLRDRRTLISMIIVPILIMPLLTIGMGVLMSEIVGKAKQQIPKVMILGGGDSPQIMAQLAALKDIEIVPARPDYADEISNKQIRAAIEIPPGFDAAIQAGRQVTLKIDDYQGDLNSGIAADNLRKELSDYRDTTVRRRLESRNLPESLITPFDITEQNVASPEKVTGAEIGGIIPYIVILLCLTGAMYPAIDLTAGEKERGTMETILSSPVSRLHLVLGKFLMVFTASLSTAALAVASMGVSFGIGKRMLMSMASGGDSNALQLSVNLKSVLAVFGMVVPLAVLFSAALLAISLYAKSYKEAQSYISPLIPIVIIPAVISLLPGVDLNAHLALIPVLNTSLVSKEIITGTYHWKLIALIFASSCVYAAAALAIAVKLFQREDVLFRT
ncbi:MAG TPA: ABC transporter permease [Methylomirabilota bacterium]|nr:ABC transporter permease [Methylomirabilota bacterium]